MQICTYIDVTNIVNMVLNNKRNGSTLEDIVVIPEKERQTDGHRQR